MGKTIGIIERLGRDDAYRTRKITGGESAGEDAIKLVEEGELQII